MVVEVDKEVDVQGRRDRIQGQQRSILAFIEVSSPTEMRFSPWVTTSDVTASFIDSSWSLGMRDSWVRFAMDSHSERWRERRGGFRESGHMGNNDILRIIGTFERYS